MDAAGAAAFGLAAQHTSAAIAGADRLAGLRDRLVDGIRSAVPAAVYRGERVISIRKPAEGASASGSGRQRQRRRGAEQEALAPEHHTLFDALRAWRRDEAERLTRERRPDLWQRHLETAARAATNDRPRKD